MSWQLLTRPQVEADIDQGADWYDERESGLGAEFAREVWSTIDRIAKNPLLYRVLHSRLLVRWVIPERFPYRIVFTVAGRVVIVVGVIHAKRRDREWKNRL